MSIIMGNDEFILYIRKQHPGCTISNDALGRAIWRWLRDADIQARKVAEDVDCYWGKTGAFIADTRLPKTATQFSFDSSVLPRLYAFLDQLGQDEAADLSEA
jgi:hypothetical protein